MNDLANKTVICSVIALELIDFSRKNKTEQRDARQQFDALIATAVGDIPAADYQVSHEAEGAATIICLGPLEDALEDALLIALTVRDSLLQHNQQQSKPSYVQIGISLGAVLLSPQKDGVGEGLDEARRIMSFAKPNQILVSRAYHEMAAKLTPEMAAMFEQYDMHAHHQEIYAVRLLKESATMAQPSVPAQAALLEPMPAAAADSSWKYGLAGVLTLLILYGVAKLVFTTAEPTITMDPPPVPQATVEPSASPIADVSEPVAPVVTTVPDAAEKTQAAKPVAPAAKADRADKKQATANAKPVANDSEPKSPAKESAATATSKPAVANTEKQTAETQPKSSWEKLKDSVQKGTSRACTQVEIAMNQCRQ